jgi:hypothetical protein
VRFVASAQELASALQDSESSFANAREQDLFFIDPNFPRWRHLMNLRDQYSR